MKLKSLALGIVIILLLSTNQNSFAISATIRGNLPSVLPEASGVDFNGDNCFWSHNDRGGSNKIYRVSNTGTLKQTVVINGATNYDWEDITHNASRTTMYIGDFGNNYFDRKNLKIYKFAYPTSTTTSVTASVINFSYPDQRKFPSPWKNFDAEAFFHYNNKLYIFTKGDGTAIGYTKLYTVPDAPGTYIATLIDSFHVNSRVTSAAISPDEKSVVLITNTLVFLFKGFSGSNIFNGQCTKISIAGSWTQKEGVTFSTSSYIYLVDEGSPSRLYTIDLASYMAPPARLASEETSTDIIDSKLKVSAFPNPANSSLTFQTGEKFEKVELIITDLSGQIVKQEIFMNPDDKIQIDSDNMKSGMYAVRIIGDNRKDATLMVSIIH
jgi:hypothetical protein